MWFRRDKKVKSYKMILHFVSGETLEIEYEEEEYLMKSVDQLSKNWDRSVQTSKYFGINYSHVTHYKVIEV
jgi:hypothetical protein